MAVAAVQVAPFCQDDVIVQRLLTPDLSVALWSISLKHCHLCDECFRSCILDEQRQLIGSELEPRTYFMLADTEISILDPNLTIALKMCSSLFSTRIGH